ncbi:hypothetical protein Tco_0534170 [Tanacetum coccineum]
MYTCTPIAAAMWQAFIGQPPPRACKWDPHDMSLLTSAGQQDGSTDRVAMCHGSGQVAMCHHQSGPRGIQVAADVAVENIAKPGLGQARTWDLG